ncbi:MAG: hypothetical protein GX774_05770 [Armatimonadetes bacterium]|jgi:uroporphyrinogen-III decarboxylase|nr:hypothetical protein [Armatimonadota bacterium]
MSAATSRERVFAALSLDGTDDFPVLLPYLGILLRDHWAEITNLPWWVELAGDIESRFQVARDLLEATAIDWTPGEMCAGRAWREEHRVGHEGGRVFLQNRVSGERREVHPEPPGGTQSFAKTPLITSIADVDRLLPITPHTQLVAEGYLDYARRAVAALGSDHFIFASVGAPFWCAFNYLTFEGLMTAVVENSDLLGYLLERLTAQQIESVRAYAAAGIHGVWVEDCYSSADLISAEQFRRFALPYVARVIAEIKALGMHAVYYFCGDVHDRLTDLVAAGPSALSLEESKKGFRIDLAEVAEIVRGRCALLGNLDAVGVLEQGDSETLRRALAQQAAVGRKWPRFAFSLGSPVTALTPLSRVQEYVRTARELASSAA